MDSIQTVEEAIRAITFGNYLVISGTVLALYDYLLMLDDEVQFMWKGRKTLIFYLYMLNRIIFNAYRSWQIYASWCVSAFYVGGVLTWFFLTSSDIFIILRIYALTLKNKLILVFFGILALAKDGVWLAIYLPHMTVFEPPSVPIDTLDICTYLWSSPYKMVPVILGTVFDVSAFLVIAWCAYRNMPVLRLSAVVRTIVTEGTIYFLAVLAMQIYIQLSYIFMDPIGLGNSHLAYVALNPILTMRFALSLKRSAESEYELNSIQSSSVKFRTLVGSQVPDSFEGIEMDPIHSPTGPAANP